MKQLKQGIDGIFHISQTVCKMLLCMIFGLMWVVVFGRYFFSYTPMWSEDLILFSMCWMVMLSGAEAFRRDAHLKITIFQDMFPKRVKAGLQVVLDIFTALFFAFLIKEGIEQILSNITVYYTGFKISKMWLFLCFPISFVLIILAKVDKYITRCLKKGGNAV